MPGKNKSKLNAEQKALRAEGKCGCRKKSGPGYCGRPAGWGTDHVGFGGCKYHGGSTPSGKHNAMTARIAAEQRLFGEPREIEPHAALKEELHRTAGHVSWLTMMIQSMEHVDDLHGPVGGGQGGYPSEEAHIWVKLQQAERSHFAKVAKLCIDAGIAEREIELAETQGQLIAQLLTGVLEDLGIDPRSKKAREVVGRRLSAIEGTARELEAEANGNGSA